MAGREGGFGEGVSGADEGRGGESERVIDVGRVGMRGPRLVVVVDVVQRDRARGGVRETEDELAELFVFVFLFCFWVGR